jgi:hypothetical protein
MMIKRMKSRQPKAILYATAAMVLCGAIARAQVIPDVRALTLNGSARIVQSAYGPVLRLVYHARARGAADFGGSVEVAIRVEDNSGTGASPVGLARETVQHGPMARGDPYLWDTASSPDCQVYVANWTDTSVWLEANLPQDTENLNSVTLSPVADLSPLTFFPALGCTVSKNDVLTFAVANPQTGNPLPSTFSVSVQ